MLLGVAVVALFTSAWPWSVGQLAGLTFAWWAYHRQRDTHTERHDLCAGCAEGGHGGVCAGFSEQAVHLRAYEDAATDWLEKGYSP